MASMASLTFCMFPNGESSKYAVFKLRTYYSLQGSQDMQNPWCGAAQKHQTKYILYRTVAISASKHISGNRRGKCGLISWKFRTEQSLHQNIFLEPTRIMWIFFVEISASKQISEKRSVHLSYVHLHCGIRSTVQNYGPECNMQKAFSTKSN